MDRPAINFSSMPVEAVLYGIKRASNIPSINVKLTSHYGIVASQYQHFQFQKLRWSAPN